MNRLENLFFYQKDRELMAHYEAMQKMQETKENLRRVSGLQDEHVLDKLLELNIRPEVLASLSTVPLVLVAWADGNVDAKEKDAVLGAVKKFGWEKGGIDYTLLERWLDRKPSTELADAWFLYVEGLCQKLSGEEVQAFKKEILDHARAVAHTSGGIFGLGAMSRDEKKMIAKIETAFTMCKREQAP
jgi:hypothetical protein